MGELLGIASAEQGVLLRMLDKIQRLKSFYTTGELKVKSESHVDALRDIIGYSLILIGLSKEDNGKPKLPKS